MWRSATNTTRIYRVVGCVKRTPTLTHSVTEKLNKQARSNKLFLLRTFHNNNKNKNKNKNKSQNQQQQRKLLNKMTKQDVLEIGSKATHSTHKETLQINSHNRRVITYKILFNFYITVYHQYGFTFLTLSILKPMVWKKSTEKVTFMKELSTEQR